MTGRDETVEERQARVGRNEALFRMINEKLEDLNETFSVVTEDGHFEIVCECGDITCVAAIMIHPAVYARTRNDSTLFILVPGHEDATVEVVVEDHEAGYVVVRKHPGGPADLAAKRTLDS